ncbi:MAG: hypothetical protein U0941_12630 [Planctomycetaceae bacterium]
MKNLLQQYFGFARVLRCFVACGVVALSTVAMAQDRIGTEEAQKVGRKLVDLLGTPADAQLTISADTDRGEGYKHGELGLLVLPDQKLTAAVLEGAKAEPVPVGQLWMKGITPVSDGVIVPVAKHRKLTVTEGDKSVDVTVCLLGARKRDGKMELVLYGQGKEPITVAALEPDQSTSTAPIGVTVAKETEETGRIELTLAGKFKAKLFVKRAE